MAKYFYFWQTISKRPNGNHASAKQLDLAGKVDLDNIVNGSIKDL